MVSQIRADRSNAADIGVENGPGRNQCDQGPGAPDCPLKLHEVAVIRYGDQHAVSARHLPRPDRAAIPRARRQAAVDAEEGHRLLQLLGLTAHLLGRRRQLFRARCVLLRGLAKLCVSPGLAYESYYAVRLAVV